MVMQTFNSAHIKAPYTLVSFCFTTAFYNENDQRLHWCLHWCFRNDLRLHYTTENARHMTIHAGTTIDMYR